MSLSEKVIEKMPLKNCLIIIFTTTILLLASGSARAEVSVPLTDQTVSPSLPAPNPNLINPRYISGFGVENTYTIFYEDRCAGGCASGSPIFFNQTINGAFNFATVSTPTNLCDTHFVVKDWPITIDPPHPNAGNYAYRGWGAVGNNPNNHFYVSNNLTNWTLISTFTFTDPSGTVLNGGENIFYGFHDVIQLNGNYVGFGETNLSRTLIVWSDDGDDNWQVIAEVGGSGPTHAPLNLRFSPTISGPTPTGNFILMEVDGNLVYGKASIPGDDSGIYLAINAAAAQAATPAQAEAAFINPANWTWRDGSTGLPDADNLVVSSTAGSGGHDTREAWAAPLSNPQSDWVIIYTGEYDSAGGLANRALGCASSSSECLVEDPPTIGGGTVLDPEIASTLPQTGFQPDRKTTIEEQPISMTYHDTSITLDIPSLGVQIPVVGVPLVKGEWHVEWLNRRAGWLEGTAFPTWQGNTAITAHVWEANNLPGPFVELKELQYGDLVRVIAFGQVHEYLVKTNRLVLPSNLRTLEHKDLDWLTLLTCEEYSPWMHAYSFRRAVQAVLVSVHPE